jgi:hypothetical protein
MDVPIIQLPTENFINKEMYIPNAYYLAQPVGKLACIWFTKVNEVPTCIMIDIKDHKLNQQTILSTVFDVELIGTLIQGTFIHYESQPCFVIHNIFYYKYELVVKPYPEKYTLIETIINKYILNETMSIQQCMFFLPATSFCIKNIEASYKIFCIKIIDTENKILNYVDNTHLKLLWVHSTDIKDIYEIYTLDNVYHSIAHIDTYKRSIMLNKIFKKEISIDSIEESDDEEPFLTKKFKMYCKWNESIKKWIPVKQY